MVRILGAAALCMVLAACGGAGGNKAALVKSCVADGQSQEQCDCMADAAQTELKPATFTKLVKAAKAGEEAGNEMMGDLSPDEQGEFMAFAMKAAMTCGAM